MVDTQALYDLTGIGCGTLRSWIRAGYIAPVMVGSKGKGNSHLWSARQILALTVVNALMVGIGASGDPLRRVIQDIESMPEDDLLGWIQNVTSSPSPSPMGWYRDLDNEIRLRVRDVWQRLGASLSD